MTDYRGDGVRTTRGADEVYVERRRGGGLGRTLAILLALALLVVVVLFATGFWRINTSGQLKAPDVDVSVKGGEVPNVDLDSKKVVVGTKETSVEVPKVEVDTKKAKVDVPVVGVTEGKTDAKK